MEVGSDLSERWRRQEQPPARRQVVAPRPQLRSVLGCVGGKLCGAGLTSDPTDPRGATLKTLKWNKTIGASFE